MAEYATHAALERLGESLRGDLRDTERLLRDRDDEKERQLRGEFLDAIAASDARHEQRFDHIDATLAEQNKWIMRRRFRWATWRRDLASLTVAGVVSTLVLHFVFGL